jgi:hypothetical protein
VTPDPLTLPMVRAGCVAMLVAAIAGTLRVSPPDATSLAAAAGCAFAGAWELARRLAPQRPPRDTDLRAVYPPQT